MSARSAGNSLSAIRAIVDELNEECELSRITRRNFVFGSAAVSLVGGRGLGQAAARGSSGTRLLLVGTQTSGTSKGVYSYSFDPAAGDLKLLGLATETENPTFLALSPNRRTVLVANELDTYEGKSSGAVSTYSLDQAKARLTKISEVASGGGGTCHVAFDQTGRCAFAANYGGGSAASFTIDVDGRLSRSGHVSSVHRAWAGCRAAEGAACASRDGVAGQPVSFRQRPGAGRDPHLSAESGDCGTDSE